MDNQTFLNKADTQVADLQANGGYMTTEQAQKFFELLITPSKLLSMIFTKPMARPTFELDKMGFTGRVLRAAVENKALGENDRTRPEFAKATLTAKEFVAEARMSYKSVEDNIEGNTFMNTLQTLLAKAVGRDMENYSINGDTTSSDLEFKKLDGFLKRATSHVVASGSVRLTKGILKSMMQTVPPAYFEDFDKMLYMTSKNAVLDYLDSLSNRQTPGGDAALQAKIATAEYAGVGVRAVPLMPENLGSGTDETDVILSDPQNLCVGIQREIRMESYRAPSEREYVVVCTVCFDANYVHEPAVVKATEVTASPS